MVKWLRHMKRGLKKDDVGKEIANVVIYLLGWSKNLNVDLESEFLKKIKK